MANQDKPDHWRPNTDLDLLQQRASLLQRVREFMRQRSILEVETPFLSPTGNTDPNIHSLQTRMRQAGGIDTWYLHTSPEFAMKRLLAAGSGSIYQICRVFRDDETSRLHQPEFTMLEWYRIGFDHHQLMDEMGELLAGLDWPGCERRSYSEVFQEFCQLDPHGTPLTELQRHAGERGLAGVESDRSILLDFIFSHRVMPHLGRTSPLLVYDFPACQAALARISDTTPPLAERFELIIDGVEIANGYNELTDYNEVKSRFFRENDCRRNRGDNEIPVDDRLLAALRHGLPPCAGVAVGLDRLLMVKSGCRDLGDVVAFPLPTANLSGR